MKCSIQLDGRQGAVVPTAAKRFRNSRVFSRSTASRGFSLVELLVVITIIGMLVGLLMPALIAARGRARIAQCTNNQKELGLAIFQYEGAKQRLPGYANRVNGSQISWVPVLFPYLGRMDLWDGPSNDGWRKGGSSVVTVRTRLAQVVCPNGSPGAVSPDTPLSYVVNAYAYSTTTSAMAAEISVFRDLFATSPNPTAPTNAINLSNVKSPSRRPMISERNYILDSSNSATSANRSWSETGNTVTSLRFGFVWPGSTTAQYPLNGTATVASCKFADGYLPAIHQGVVIVTFFDVHVESLTDNTDCSTFDYTSM